MAISLEYIFQDYVVSVRVFISDQWRSQVRPSERFVTGPDRMLTANISILITVVDISPSPRASVISIFAFPILTFYR